MQSNLILGRFRNDTAAPEIVESPRQAVEKKERRLVNEEELEKPGIDFKGEKEGQRLYCPSDSTIIADNFYILKNKYIPLKNPPAIIEKKESKAEKKLTDKQKNYKKRVVTMADLRRATPNVINNTNRQGLRRFIFVNDLIASKNGLIYYLIPLLINIAFLIYNFTKYNFLPNAALSIVALIAFIAEIKIVKSSTLSTVKKALLFILVLILFAAALYGATYIVGFYESIYLPFTIKIFLIFIGLYYFVRFYATFYRSYGEDCNLDFGNTVQIKAGKPRVGKTSSAVQDVRVLALKKWEQLQFDFHDWHSREKEILKRNNKNELLEYYEIKQSYQFYIVRRCIPCLWSNIGIEDDRGYRSHKITLAHLQGVDRLPIYSVVLLDEIGAMLKAELAVDKSRPYDVSDMFRLGGHFLKWTVIACEQDFNNIYIDCRRVVGFNQLISSQTWTCRPLILYGIYKLLKFTIIESVANKQRRRPKLMKFMHAFEKFVYSIGFRRYTFSFVENTQTDAKIVTQNDESRFVEVSSSKVRYVPSRLIARYDDRAYKQLYPSYFDKDIKGELHNHLFIEGTDILYGRQFISETHILKEKREGIDVDIEKLE